MLSFERRAGCPDGIDTVTLGAPRTLQCADFDDVLSGLSEGGYKASGETAGSFQSPDSPARRMVVSPQHHPRVPSASRRFDNVRSDPAGRRV
jgi:hypothetical protein